MSRSYKIEKLLRAFPKSYLEGFEAYLASPLSHADADLRRIFALLHPENRVLAPNKTTDPILHLTLYPDRKYNPQRIRHLRHRLVTAFMEFVHIKELRQDQQAFRLQWYKTLARHGLADLLESEYQIRTKRNPAHPVTCENEYHHQLEVEYAYYLQGPPSKPAEQAEVLHKALAALENYYACKKAELTCALNEVRAYLPPSVAAIPGAANTTSNTAIKPRETAQIAEFARRIPTWTQTNDPQQLYPEVAELLKANGKIPDKLWRRLCLGLLPQSPPDAGANGPGGFETLLGALLKKPPGNERVKLLPRNFRKLFYTAHRLRRPDLAEAFSRLYQPQLSAPQRSVADHYCEGLRCFLREDWARAETRFLQMIDDYQEPEDKIEARFWLMRICLERKAYIDHRLIRSQARIIRQYLSRKARVPEAIQQNILQTSSAYLSVYRAHINDRSPSAGQLAAIRSRKWNEYGAEWLADYIARHFPGTAGQSAQ